MTPVQSQPPPGVPISVPPPEREWYTYDEIAVFFFVQRTTVYQWVRQGRIPSPVYHGHTARFTADQFDVIKEGPSPKGTFVRGNSPRAALGKRAAKKRLTAKKKAAKKPTAKKPTAKKPTAKKGGAK